MSTDIGALLLGKFNSHDVALMIEKMGFYEIKVGVPGKGSYELDGIKHHTENNFIRFQVSDNPVHGKAATRNLHVFWSSAFEYPDVTGNNETTHASLSSFGCAEHVIRGLLEQTGGWLRDEATMSDWVPMAKVSGIPWDEIVLNRAQIIANQLQTSANQTMADMHLPAETVAGLDVYLMEWLKTRMQLVSVPTTIPWVENSGPGDNETNEVSGPRL